MIAAAQSGRMRMGVTCPSNAWIGITVYKPGTIQKCPEYEEYYPNPCIGKLSSSHWFLQPQLFSTPFLSCMANKWLVARIPVTATSIYKVHR